jgi:phosphoribosylamine---glycine ligase
MIVCVVGAGGREHALADALSQSAEVIITPGSLAMARTDGPHPITVTTADPRAIDADLFVIGPEAPLVDGLADELRAMGRLVFGPGADGARLEGSKAFMKELAHAAGVPTAAYATFTNADAATRFLESLPGPFVIKTDGLAAGKGVLVTSDLSEAVADVRAKLDGSAFGAAGTRVVIEEYLDGEELSLLVLCDGRRAVALPAARDFKRVGDGDLGPNTGGMGAFSPVPTATGDVVASVMDEIVSPTLAELVARGIDYRGVLYAGCMLGARGPRLVEFNVRFGDPETEVVLPLVDDDLAAILAQAAAGDLERAPRVRSGAALCVVLASPGYPAAPEVGGVITGLDEAGTVDGVRIYHAGTTVDDGIVRTSGGRALVVSATGSDLARARDAAYTAVGAIDFPGMVYRRDIGAAVTSGIGVSA